MARTPKSADGSPKPARPVGPKTLYIVFPHGTDPATVEAVRNAQVTFNGRVLLKALAGGSPAPFLTFTIEAEKRNKAE
jgi:hypothetical protein